MAFVGAGVPAGLDYPTWTELLGILAAEAGTICSGQVQDTFGKMLTVQQVMEMPDQLLRAEIFKYNLKDRYFELMERLFGERNETPPTVRDLIELPFAHMLTTNYDPTLELAHTRSGRQFQYIRTLLEAAGFLNGLGSSSDRHIVHVHGWYGSPKTIILTEGDYSLLYGHKFADDFWEIVAIRERCIFFGFSFTDEDVMEHFNLRNFNRVHRIHGNLKHFALVPLDDIKKEPGARTSLRTRYGIEPVFFNKIDKTFSGYAGVLRSILRSARPSDQEPIRRDVEMLERITNMNINARLTGELP
jgi:hypothetical protein